MMNRTMKLLMLSDIFVLTGFGLIQPILAIFINQGVDWRYGIDCRHSQHHLPPDQVPGTVALREIHRRSRQEDPMADPWHLAHGIVPILYITADSMYKVYLAELIYGLGSGLAYPTWLGLWSRNLNRGKKASSGLSIRPLLALGLRLQGLLGAAMASITGFTTTFLLAGAMCLLGCVTLIVLESRSAEKVEDYKKA